MKKYYSLLGMHCQGCRRQTEKEFSAVTGVKHASVSFYDKRFSIDADKEFSVEELQRVLNKYNGKYTVGPDWNISKRIFLRLATFRPLIVATLLVLLWTWWRVSGMSHFMWEMAAQQFMAGFFLVFGLLKVVSWPKFARGFKGYDLLAKYVPGYAESYPAIEMFLFYCFATGKFLVAANIITIIVMGTGFVGIYKSLKGGNQITCACVGGWFSLPLTKVTLVENAIMIVMAIIMLIYGR